MSIYIDIEKKAGNFHLNVKTEAGDEVLALLGASGCGKSMTLRCIAGIETPDRGRIILDGVTLFDSEKKINLSPQQRRTGLMFQNYALFPNMTVYQNIRTGTLRDKALKDRDGKIREIIERFGLTGLENHLPHQLSGGQQQRTALARILISDPGILLLDEPFSALDTHLRFQLEREVRSVIRDFGRSVILVSHNLEEVYRAADKIAIMDCGQVTAFSNRETIFRCPSSRAAARLTGVTNIFKANVLAAGKIILPGLGLQLAASLSAEGAWYVGLRPGDIHIGEGENSFKAIISEITENPASATVFLRPVGPNLMPEGVEERFLCMEVSKAQAAGLHLEDEIQVYIPADAVLPLKG